MLRTVSRVAVERAGRDGSAGIRSSNLFRLLFAKPTTSFSPVQSPTEMRRLKMSFRCYHPLHRWQICIQTKRFRLSPPRSPQPPVLGMTQPIVRMGLQRMDICVLTVPYDSGVYGARMGRGPKLLLESGLKASLIRLGHKVTVEEIRVSANPTAEIATAFELCRLVAGRVHECLKAGAFPILLSGNCNTAIGAIAGCGSQNTGVAWFDAHGESTTPE